jgi:hypothetical protein
VACKQVVCGCGASWVCAVVARLAPYVQCVRWQRAGVDLRQEQEAAIAAGMAAWCDAQPAWCWCWLDWWQDGAGEALCM